MGSNRWFWTGNSEGEGKTSPERVQFERIEGKGLGARRLEKSLARSIEKEKGTVFDEVGDGDSLWYDAR